MHTEKPVSKVLVLDNALEHMATLKRFCEEHGLIGLKVSKGRLLPVLRSNIDLGAILMAEDYAGSLAESAEIAIAIHAVRPELPIILRREHDASLDGLTDGFRRSVCAAYVASDLSPLRQAVDEYLFSLEYPTVLVRGISEITEGMLASLFKNVAITKEIPCIVRDRIIFGEVFSLIPLESTWCRGYMMMQTEEESMLKLLDKFRLCDGEADFRDLNSVLGEITNLVWGGFKNRFLGDEAALSRSQVQVPLIVNHKQKYISFGTENPQLCFIYQLIDEESGNVVKLYQRFVFNLTWSPENFKESPHDAGALVDAGALELF